MRHSSAVFDSAMNAINIGMRMVPYNCYPIKFLHHRAVGHIGAALRRDVVHPRMIAGNIQIHRDLIRLLTYLY